MSTRRSQRLWAGATLFAPLLFTLLWARAAAATPADDAWDRSRAQLEGLCEDRVAGRPVAPADLERLRAEEQQQRQALQAEADQALLQAGLQELRTRHDVARERSLGWSRAHLEAIEDLLGRGHDLLRRSPGKTSAAQQEAFLDALDRVQAGLARIKLASGQPLSEAQADELLGVLDQLFAAGQPLLAAGAQVLPKLLRDGAAMSEARRTPRSAEVAGLAAQKRFEAGEPGPALDDLLRLFAAEPALPAAVAAAQRRRAEWGTRLAAHVQRASRCEAAAPAAAAVTPPAPTAPQAAPSGTDLDHELDRLAEQALAGPAPGGPALDALPRGLWLSDPAAAALGADGAPLRFQGAGRVLPVDLWVSLAEPLRPQAPPVDATAQHFGSLGAGDSPSGRAALQAALAEGKGKEATELLQRVSGAPAAELPAIVERRIAEEKARAAAAALPPAPSPAELASTLPEPGPAQAEAELLAAARELLLRRPKPQRTVAAPARLQPPATRADGSPDHEARLQAVLAKRPAQSERLLARPMKDALRKVSAARAALNQANAKAEAEHLARLRALAFGPPPSQCPAGYSLCGCPEQQALEDLRGQCCPAGATCGGAAPADLSFR